MTSLAFVVCWGKRKHHNQSDGRGNFRAIVIYTFTEVDPMERMDKMMPVITRPPLIVGRALVAWTP